ncbi:PEPxxWA-CTERM sorting domain-containing protein [Sphingomonas sp. BK235]|uniref:PEPxxWA-CTERM sorting domain-containing protein n=1 Tax=Sphingomonas sp. BK235 TaxID=2512131 RepID=UPI0010D0EC94|nr:PEPxxWA-CTERM sorting domain-containing protein [Sphingomonas sp. BK235]TCP30061.1 putative secreted protein with PEP-CTERM sorting signal [Sphingomonas sp. BK235]
MSKMIMPLLTAAFAVLTSMPAEAAVQMLDFTQGNYCNGGELCTNNAAIDKGHGSTAEVSVNFGSTYDGFPSGPLYYYERGFGDLVGVAYSNKGSTDFRTRARITLSAAAGYEITLKSFDLGCFVNLANCQTATYNVNPGAGGYQTGSLGTGYPTHQNVTFNAGYGNVIDLWFGAGENVGIDNIKWDVRAVGAGAVPEPATWAMMILGFGLVGTSLRRRAPTLRRQLV